MQEASDGTPWPESLLFLPTTKWIDTNVEQSSVTNTYIQETLSQGEGYDLRKRTETIVHTELRAVWRY